MQHPARSVWLLLALIVLAPAPGSAQNFGGVRAEERYFRVEFETAQASGKRATVRGYVANTHHWAAQNVSLLIEGLDSSGRAVNQTVAWVNGVISVGGRRYFEAVAPTPGTTFRVTVLYYDWVCADDR